MSITEVARLAGVSSSTVSRVINNRPRVSRDTIDAVRAAMATLKYQPSENRPGPKPGPRSTPARSATVALLVLGVGAGTATPAFAELMRGVSKGAAEWDLKLVYLPIVDPAQLPRQLEDGEIDGLLLHGTLPPPAVRERLRQFPTVWLMGNRRRPDFGDHVLPDTFEIGDKAARYLMGRGHTRLAYLNLDKNHWPFRAASQSFAAAARPAGAGVTVLESTRADGDVEQGVFAPDAVDALAARFVALSPRPTGIFVADDMQAALLQPALQRAGVVLAPGQAEVISCNNERPYLAGLSPKPAVIDTRVESIGYRAIERLLWRLNNPDVPERVITAVEPAVLNHDGLRVDFLKGLGK